MIDKIKMLPTNQLFIDGMYQRDLKRNRANKLIKEWCEDIEMPLLVNKRSSGMYSVIDGQHRLERYITEGITEVCCSVLEHKTIEDEAKLFQRVNINRNAPTSLEIFKASLAAKDGLYLQIEEIVYKNGYDFPFVSPSENTPEKRTKDNQIKAVGTLRRIAYDRNKTCGLEVLNETLEIIQNVWGNDTDAISGQMLSGLSRFIVGIKNVEYFDKDRLLHTLKRKAAYEIIRDARKYKIMYQGEMETNVVLAIIDAYNHRLQNGNKLDVRDVLQTHRNDYVDRQEIA